MIDYLRAQVVGIDTATIYQRENLSFTQEVNTRTGELSEKLKAECKNLALEYFPTSGRMTIAGSLHKYWNDGFHNFNDFALSDLHELENRLFEDTGLRYDNLKLTRLEFGLNVQIEQEVKAILHGSLMHLSQAPSRRDTFQGKGEFLLFHHNRYELKLYDKGKQYKQGKGLFRFEVKHTNWTEYRLRGFQTLAEVVESALTLLRADLMKKWSEIVFFDPTNLNPSRPNYKSVSFWEELQKRSAPTRKKHRDKLKAMNATEGTDLQNRIGEALEKKLSELMDKGGTTNERRTA